MNYPLSERVRFAWRALTDRRFHVSQEPPGWIDTIGPGYETVTGVTVSPDSSLQFIAVFACVRILAETIASLPLILYRRLPDGGKERAVDHPLYPLLHDLPNDEMTSYAWRETLMGHVTTWGNCYSQIVFDQGGRVASLWPLRPDQMRVERSAQTGKLVYFYRKSNAAPEQPVPAENILHIPGLGFDGITGYSPIQQARQAVGLGLAAEEFGARFFGNDARPGVVLQHPGKLGAEAHERLRKSWETRHGGLEKSHRVAILEEGLTVKEIGIPPEDAQFLETRKFQVTEIARLYRIPPHLLADLDRATFSNIEQQSLEFVIHTIRPWTVRWEQSLTHKLLTPDERGQYFIEYLIDGLLRGDITARYAAYAQGRQNGWLSANDIRERENMNPVEGGDVYLIPLNMIPASSAGEGFAAPRSAMSDGRRSLVDGDREGRGQRSAASRRRLMLAQRRIYRDTAGRILRREVNDVGASIQKFLGRRDVQSFTTWLAEFYREHKEFVYRQMHPVNQSYAEMVAGHIEDELNQQPDASPTGRSARLAKFVDSYTASYANRHAAISEERVRAVLQRALADQTDPGETLAAEFEGWPAQRGEQIAVDEATRANNAAAATLYSMAGVLALRWRSFNKSCPYCQSLDGRVVGMQDYFLMAGQDYQPEGAERPLKPGSDVRHPPAHDGCDCMITAG